MTAVKKKSALSEATGRDAAEAALQSSNSKRTHIKYTTPYTKIKALICGMTSVFGFFLMLGAAGGIELGSLPDWPGFLWLWAGLLLFWLGAKAGGL